MPRATSTLLVVALLAGTAAAFGVTQGLKAEKSPIARTEVDKVLSPVCDCETRSATIGFVLRKPDRVVLEVLRDDEVVRVLAEGNRPRRGAVRYTWNGRDDQGEFVEDGVYRVRIHLEEQRRTIVLPNEMRVDTTPPQIVSFTVRPGAFSPDGDGRGDRVRIGYVFSEQAHAILLVDGRRVTYTRSKEPRGAVAWNGKVDGKVVRRGFHTLALMAEDVAGNVSVRATRPVEVRFVRLSRGVVRVGPRGRFGVRVDADAPVRWRLAGQSGTARPGRLVLRAPVTPGEYVLVARLGTHVARARVVVRGPA